MIGTITFRQRTHQFAPSRCAASRISCGTALIPAVSTTALNGRFRQTLTMMIEIIAGYSSPSQFGPSVNNPAWTPIQLMTLYVGLSIHVQAMAPIAIGIVNGIMMSARAIRRPRKF